MLPSLCRLKLGDNTVSTAGVYEKASMECPDLPGAGDLRSQLRITTTTNGVKRVRDGMLSLVNQASLKAGRFPREYELLVEDIIKHLQPPNIYTPSLQFYALQELQVLLRGSAPYRVFEPSNEARHAVVSPKSVTYDMASLIALAFFKSIAEAPPAVLSGIYEKKRSRAQAVIDSVSTKAPEELTRDEKIDMEMALLDLEQLDDRTETTADLFVQQHTDLIRTFAYDAVDSFLLLPDSDLRPLLNASVQLVLQYVDAPQYKPIADVKHMDGEIDFSKQGGSRYGRPAAEQDVQSIVTSFCADLVSTGQIALSPCSTVYFENAPVVKPELLVDAARKVQQHPGMSVMTEYEIISVMGSALVRATSSALEKRSERDLWQMGIVANAVNMLEWTNANALAFHRSALRDEVLAGAVPTANGGVAPRMRAFAIVITDNPVSSEDRILAINGGSTKDIKLPNITRMGREIKVDAFVTVLKGGLGAGMGEDAMP